MLKRLNIFIGLFFATIFFSFYIYAANLPKHFLFDNENSLGEWEEKIFHGRVAYEIKTDSAKGYLSATSNKASSGLFHKITFDPRKNPYISWGWKVEEFPSNGLSTGEFTKKGWIERDDYAARVYVIFPSFIFTNTECLEYIWAENLPQGTILTSPFFSNIKLMVLESGRENLNKWVYQERNISEDYKKAFNRPLRRKVGAIALMTDSDNTQSSAKGCYADIKVGYDVSVPVEIKAKFDIYESLKSFLNKLNTIFKK